MTPAKNDTKMTPAVFAELMEGHNALNKRTKEIHAPEVVRYGDKLIVPETMPIPSAIKALQEVMADEETIVAISEDIDCFPLEGAVALRDAIEDMFGYSRTKATPGFFGPVPPDEISIQTSLTTKTTAPWGRFHFALADSDEQFLATGTANKDGRLIFKIGGQVKKKFLSIIKQLADKTRENVKTKSIYRGQALKIAFTNKSGEVIPMPTPDFLDVSNGSLENMVYTRELETLMDVNVLTPLRSKDACIRAGIPLKRGVLLAGPYGTGKSLFASAVAKVATDNAWTYIYIRNASELPRALQFAQMYEPAVVFAEDVDRNVTGGRTDEMDKILNTLDGIDSKKMNTMVILTTNHLDQINRAMLRPGRIDVILEITPPDADAVQRLMRVYGRQFIEKDAVLTEAGAILQGQTPAIIREVVERSKLAMIARTGTETTPVSGADLLVAAQTMMQQQNLLREKTIEPSDIGTQFVRAVASETVQALKGNGLGTMETQVQELYNAL